MISLLTCSSSPRINKLSAKRTKETAVIKDGGVPIKIAYSLLTTAGPDKNTCSVKLNVIANGKKAPLNITLEAEAIFNINDDVTDEQLDNAGASIAGPIVFSFVLEQIADTTRKMGFPPLILPYPDFTKIPSESTEKDIED
ncbi:protein-export chaperone SecB [uncultured Desulfuromusa sp.]|uniref:protein-export chaperone SecB n=1 Tax=uncultured Desulfuromusa sp. TaxID=219183 RepID=UPI002AA76DEE|nr:protein-export chaperone SecB [uncultured Desulfuromusa sp.]